MSHLPVEALSYEAVVAEYFLGLRGAGLMLSPLDVEQVRAWSRRGLPVEIVCRGLRQGLEDALRLRPQGSPPPRSIRAYRRSVEDEWEAYRYGRVGSADAPSDDEGQAVRRRLDAADARLVASGAGGIPEARRLVALARGQPSTDLRALEVLFGQIDAILVKAWLSSIGPERRAAVGRRCALLVGRRPPGCTPRAHRDTLGAVIAELARRAGVTLLSGSV